MSAQIISLQGYRTLRENSSLERKFFNRRPIISQEIVRLIEQSSGGTHSILSYWKGQAIKSLSMGDADLIGLWIQSRVHAAKLYELRKEVGEVNGYEHIVRTIDYWERESQGTIKMRYRRQWNLLDRNERLPSHVLFHLEKCKEWELETLLNKISEADLTNAPYFIENQKNALVEEITRLLWESGLSH